MPPGVKVIYEMPNYLPISEQVVKFVFSLISKNIFWATYFTNPMFLTYSKWMVILCNEQKVGLSWKENRSKCMLANGRSRFSLFKHLRKPFQSVHYVLIHTL